MKQQVVWNCQDGGWYRLLCIVYAQCVDVQITFGLLLLGEEGWSWVVWVRNDGQPVIQRDLSLAINHQPSSLYENRDQHAHNNFWHVLPRFIHAAFQDVAHAPLLIVSLLLLKG